MSAPFRFPRFFVTSPAPCPYLEGKTERKVFTELSGPNANELNDALGRIGFRRSQSVAYRPSCADCAACVSDMDEQDFADMVEQTPVDSYMIEYREPTADGSRGRLIGCCLTDRQGDGLSMIYSFFDSAHPMREGLGTYIIADHVLRAAKAGLPYVYLGYWVQGSPKMDYKANFRPKEALRPMGWTRLP